MVLSQRFLEEQGCRELGFSAPKLRLQGPPVAREWGWCGNPGLGRNKRRERRASYAVIELTDLA